jgi:GMP synthase-like glutamine amidotransferase
MTSCVIVEHGPVERPFVIGEALAAAGVTTDVCRPYRGDRVPDSAAGLSGVVVLGGEMSAASDGGFPSRGAELALLGDAVRRRVPLLGVCLGAQLLALAGGGSVFAGAAGLELGWTHVRLDDGAVTDPLFAGLPPVLCVLNWHGDTFELPPAAVPLASGPVYRNQAFRLGDRAWGVQFHIEVDGPAVDQFISAFSEEAALAAGGPAGLAAATAAAMSELAPARDLILARYAALVAAAGVRP